MVYLVDICGWIEWLTDGILAQKFEPYLDEYQNLIVPTSLQFELYKWAKREQGGVEALKVVALTENRAIIPLSTSLALYACRSDIGA